MLSGCPWPTPPRRTGGLGSRFLLRTRRALLVKPLPPSGSRLPSIGEHYVPPRDALHRLEAYSPYVLEGLFSELRIRRSAYTQVRDEVQPLGSARRRLPTKKCGHRA